MMETGKTMKKHTRLQLLALAVTLFGILLDQLTKLLVSGRMSLHQSIPVIEGVIHITYVQNRGAAFGMLSESRWVFLIASTVTIVAVAAYLILSKNENTLQVISLSMILSGGIGNMIDRLALGYVVDFIDFTLIDFAVFNGADSFVCVGAALLVLTLLLELREEALYEKQAKQRKAERQAQKDASALCPDEPCAAPLPEQTAEGACPPAEGACPPAEEACPPVEGVCPPAAAEEESDE